MWTENHNPECMISATHAQAMQLSPILYNDNPSSHEPQISKARITLSTKFPVKMQHSSHFSLLILLLITSLSPDDSAFAQNTVAQCGPSLLQLAPCAPFVQGMAAAPVQSCCVNLNQLYTNKPTCLCLLLQDNSLASSFPINTTLALQLPLLCKLQLDPSTCGGTSLPSLAPPTQGSSEAKPNSTVAASPVVTGAPRPSLMGYRLHHSGEDKLKAKSQLLMLLLAAIFTLLPKISY